jgi:hypothetical protein
MSISPICDFCKTELTDFGGLVFSPPENTETGTSQVEKLHVCKVCYQGMRSMFMKSPKGDETEDIQKKEYEEKVRAIIPGMYKHSKSGNMYRVIGVAKHSETLEDLVVYESQYENTISKVWVRPAKMFTDLVLVDGAYVPRFVFVSKDL